MRTGYSNGDYRWFTVVTTRYGWHSALARRTIFGDKRVLKEPEGSFWREENVRWVRSFKYYKKHSPRVGEVGVVFVI